MGGIARPQDYEIQSIDNMLLESKGQARNADRSGNELLAVSAYRRSAQLYMHKASILKRNGDEEGSAYNYKWAGVALVLGGDVARGSRVLELTKNIYLYLQQKVTANDMIAFREYKRAEAECRACARFAQKFTKEDMRNLIVLARR